MNCAQKKDLRWKATTLKKKVRKKDSPVFPVAQKSIGTFLCEDKKLKVEQKTFKLGKRAIFTVLAIGVVLASFQAINTYAISKIDGTFLFPAYYGGCIVLSTITGCLLFKDKLSSRQKLSLLIGTIAVIIMSF